MEPIRVAVIEDEILVASMLAAWLNRNKHFALAGTANNGLDGLNLCLQTKPDVALIDLMMPGMDGLTLAEQLRSHLPLLKIIILSARLDPYSIYRIHRMQIPGYVDKSCSPEVVSAAILSVARGESFQTPSYQSRLQQLHSDPNAFFKILSDREIDIIRLMMAGQTVDEITRSMDITEHTVRTHQRNIRKKLNAHNTMEILAHAKKNGLF